MTDSALDNVKRLLRKHLQPNERIIDYEGSSGFTLERDEDYFDEFMKKYAPNIEHRPIRNESELWEFVAEMEKKHNQKRR